MTDKDNMMIEVFFKQAARQQIEDNGFTERVMHSLPDRKMEAVRKLSQLWTLFCMAVAGVLFWRAVLHVWRLAGRDRVVLCYASHLVWLAGSTDGDCYHHGDTCEPVGYPVAAGYRFSLPALSNSP